MLDPRRKLICSMFAVATFAATSAIAADAVNTMAERTKACVVCHGKEGRAGTDAYYPRIAGKAEGYLYNQLINFREGRRHYAPMTYLINPLSDEYLREIAKHFAEQHPPYPPPQVADVPGETLERGRALVIFGDASKKTPACVACHGKSLTGVAPAIPGLLGLPRPYISAQLGSWKNGSRRATAPDCMAEIASRLTENDVRAVAAWLASQPIPGNAAPASGPTDDLPLPCGSAPK